MENPDGFAATFTHNRTMARLSSQIWSRKHRYYVLKMSVNGASTTLGIASRKMQVLCSDNEPYLTYRPPFQAKMLPRHRHSGLKMTVNGASLTSGLVSCKM